MPEVLFAKRISQVITSWHARLPVRGAGHVFAVLGCVLALGGCASQTFDTVKHVEPKEPLTTLCVLDPVAAPDAKVRVRSSIGMDNRLQQGPRSDASYEVQGAFVSYEVGVAPAVVERLRVRGVTVQHCSAAESPPVPRLVTEMVSATVHKTPLHNGIVFGVQSSLYLPGMSTPAWVGRFLTGDLERGIKLETASNEQAFADNLIRELESSGWIKRAK